MKKIVFLVFIIVVCSFTITGICLANQKDAFPNFTEENKSEEVPKPELGEDYLENEFDAPNIEEHQKQWYEYVGFDMENPRIQTAGDLIFNFFMPQDTDMATVMKISGLKMTTKGEAGNIAGQTQTITGLDQYTTANSISVEYSVENSFSLGFEEKVSSETKFGFLIEEAITLEFGSSQLMQTGKGQTFSRTFNAIPEVNGTIVPWQIVKYDVEMAILVRTYTTDYKLCGEGYFFLNLMSGVCRRWANGYIEHWRTGEKVVVEDFMGNYLSPENLINSIIKNGLF